MFLLFRENIKIAFGAIKSQLLRTVLTIMIIAIGITALVGILSTVSAFEANISDSFTSMGSNTFNIQRYDFTAQRSSSSEKIKINPIITYNQVADFYKKYNAPLTQTAISFTGSRTTEVKYNSIKTDPETTIVGANEHFINNSGLEIAQGRALNQLDVKNNMNVCVVGSDLVKALFKNVDPLNKTISVKGNKFTIIGVLESKGSTFSNRQDLRVIIPLQKARSIFTNPRINYALSIKTLKKDLFDNALDEAIITFRNIRKLTPVQKNNFGIEKSDDLMNRIGSITDYLFYAAWVISLITIFGSTIALMNIMLVSVSERTREIGVRKALGAKRRTIATQFFMETIIIGQLGGAIGILLGIGIGMLVASAGGFTFVTPWTAMIWATTIAFIVAIISGVYPATKAARLDPIESLRYE